MKKILTITTLILLASLGLVVSGCLKKEPGTNTNTNINQNVNTDQQAEEIDTSNWKTYRNEEYGFEFKYPGDVFLGQELSFLDINHDSSLMFGNGWFEVLQSRYNSIKSARNDILDVIDDQASTNFISDSNSFLHMVIGEQQRGLKVKVNFYHPDGNSGSILLYTPVRFILVKDLESEKMIGYWSQDDIGDITLWNKIFETIKFD